jgi:hypothetical protein
MTSLAINKSTVVGSTLIHPSPTFLKFLSVLLIVFFGFSISANADVVSQRKAGFKTNAASMKAIASAIGLRKSPAIFLKAAGLAILRHGPKYGQILTILLSSPRQMKPRRTNWLQRQNLAIQAR